MKRILIVGASSFIGTHLARRLRETHRVFGTYGHTPPRLDGVTTFRLVLAPSAPLEEWILRLRPECVIYCAGNNDPRICQRDPLTTLFVHAEVPHVLARALARSGGRLIYLSSSKVFPGDTGNYRESDETRPGSAYGQAKRQAEEHLAEYDNVFCLRLGTIFGLGSFTRRSLLDRLLDALWSGKSLPLIDDEYRTFFAVEDVAEAIACVVEAPSKSAGLYHLSHGGRDSYHSFGVALAHAFGLPERTFHPLHGEHFGMKDLPIEVRGRELSLDGTLFERTFGIRFPTLDESLFRLRRTLTAGSQ